MVAITEVPTKENVTGGDLDARIARLSGRLEGDMSRAVTASGPPPEDENNGTETNEQSPWDIDNSIAPPEEEQVAKFKAEGNEHFKAASSSKDGAQLEKALEAYIKAIGTFRYFVRNNDKEIENYVQMRIEEALKTDESDAE